MELSLGLPLKFCLAVAWHGKGLLPFALKRTWAEVCLLLRAVGSSSVHDRE